MDLRAAEFGDAAIALDDDRRIRLRRAHVEQRRQDVGSADAAIGADRDRLFDQAVGDVMHVLRRKAHHRAAGRVEGEGVGVGQADPDRGLGCGLRLVGRRHRLDPGDLRAAFLQALDLLGEGVDRLVIGHRAERHEQLAGRADRARDDHLAAGLVGDAARDLGGALVQLVHAILRIVQLQPLARAAEGIGEDDVGAGIDEILVQRRDLFRGRLVPQFRRLAGFQPHVEQVGAGRAVGQQYAFFGKQRVDGVGHGNAAFKQTS